MVAYVGIDPHREINFVTYPVSESMHLLSEGKIDALIGFPPVPQELREKNIGHVIVNSGLDRPWSQYFCCIVATQQEFIRKHPVATKRALRAILKATNFCAAEPERAARRISSNSLRLGSTKVCVSKPALESDSATRPASSSAPGSDGTPLEAE
jgi:NitT/TauT family transport system substrate-binding protein